MFPLSLKICYSWYSKLLFLWTLLVFCISQQSYYYITDFFSRSFYDFQWLTREASEIIWGRQCKFVRHVGQLCLFNKQLFLYRRFNFFNDFTKEWIGNEKKVKQKWKVNWRNMKKRKTGNKEKVCVMLCLPLPYFMFLQ